MTREALRTAVAALTRYQSHTWHIGWDGAWKCSGDTCSCGLTDALDLVDRLLAADAEAGAMLAALDELRAKMLVDADRDAVLDLMDRVGGWVSPHARLAANEQGAAEDGLDEFGDPRPPDPHTPDWYEGYAAGQRDAALGGAAEDGLAAAQLRRLAGPDELSPVLPSGRLRGWKGSER